MLSRLPRRSILPLVAGVLVMAACDDDDDDPVAPPVTETATATLATVNDTVSGASGTATFTLTEDEFIARVEVDGADTSLTLRQHVHVGGACPTAAADTNSDGFIDGLESAAVTGLILIPLDGDITTQAGGATTFPSSDATGSYTYADTVSFDDMLADLTATDPDATDQIAKLPAGAGLGLDTRIVQVYGVEDTVTLPATFMASPGLTTHQSVPIACGPIN